MLYSVTDKWNTFEHLTFGLSGVCPPLDHATCMIISTFRDCRSIEQISYKTNSTYYLTILFNGNYTKRLCDVLQEGCN